MIADPEALGAISRFDPEGRENDFTIFGISPDAMDGPFRTVAGFMIRLGIVLCLIGLLSLV
jgi:hypothetical protein